MLDNPERTARLLITLKAAVPFEADFSEQLVKHLREHGDDIAEETRRTVSNVSYAGDEGRILCHMQQPGQGRGLVVSLTHVRVPRTMPLAAAIAQYQKHRVQRLKKQDRI